MLQVHQTDVFVMEFESNVESVLKLVEGLIWSRRSRGTGACERRSTTHLCPSAGLEKQQQIYSESETDQGLVPVPVLVPVPRASVSFWKLG